MDTSFLLETIHLEIATFYMGLVNTIYWFGGFQLCSTSQSFILTVVILILSVIEAINKNFEVPQLRTYISQRPVSVSSGNTSHLRQTCAG